MNRQSLRSSLRHVAHPKFLEEQQEETGSCFTLLSICTSCCTVLLMVLVALTLCAVGLAKLVIGGLYMHGCDLQPLVPVFLIVDAMVPLVFFKTCQRKENEGGSYSLAFSCQNAAFAIGLLIAAFQLAWLIAGTVWILDVKASLDSPDYCVNATTVTPASLSSLMTTTAPPITSQSTAVVMTTSSLDNVTNTLPLSLTTGVRNSDLGTASIPTSDPSLVTRRSLIMTALGGNLTSEGQVTNRKGEENGGLGKEGDTECPSCHQVLVDFTFVVVVMNWTFTGVFVLNILCMLVTWCAIKVCA